ncbi:MAG: hypothetical protein BWY76_00874 [bacterium ADurb.Bin429]|nr:MAG: hypothetical protein BWY76_00874 [bacterium ADurb.Bin429]
MTAFRAIGLHDTTILDTVDYVSVSVTIIHLTLMRYNSLRITDDDIRRTRVPPQQDPSVWTQCGRARSYNFYATDAEVLQVIRTVFGEKFRPCSLVCLHSAEVEEGKYRLMTTVRDIEDTINFGEVDSVYIWCKPLLADLPLGAPISPYQVCAHLGLIRYITAFLGRDRKTGRIVMEESTVMLIDHVINTETGEERRYPMMLKLYQKLKRELNKLLIYSTIWTDPETGIQFESDREKMSEGVYQRIVTGTQEYTVLPGRRLA